jgi:hypothetical protein
MSEFDNAHLFRLELQFIEPSNNLTNNDLLAFFCNK